VLSRRARNLEGDDSGPERTGLADRASEEHHRILPGRRSGQTLLAIDDRRSPRVEIDSQPGDGCALLHPGHSQLRGAVADFAAA
jgi:hypothetical protein